MSKPFSFIGTLSESRLFPTQHSLLKHDPQEFAELAYLHLISLRIMLLEDTTREWAKQYCKKTCRAANFRQWRSDGTDLYVILHALTNEDETIGGDKFDAEQYRDRLSIYPVAIYRWLSDGGSGHQHEEQTRQLFVRMDNMFRINNGSLRAVRRLVQDWPGLSEGDCRLAMTRLLQFMRSKANNGEVLPYLSRLSSVRRLELHNVNNPEEDATYDEHPIKKKAPSFLATLAQVGAGAIVGSMIGHKLLHKESASSGATCAANVATVVGGIGAGFDDDYSKSIYPAPKKPKAPLVIRREP